MRYVNYIYLPEVHAEWKLLGEVYLFTNLLHQGVPFHNLLVLILLCLVALLILADLKIILKAGVHRLHVLAFFFTFVIIDILENLVLQGDVLLYQLLSFQGLVFLARNLWVIIHFEDIHPII